MDPPRRLKLEQPEQLGQLAQLKQRGQLGQLKPLEPSEQSEQPRINQSEHRSARGQPQTGRMCVRACVCLVRSWNPTLQACKIQVK